MSSVIPADQRDPAEQSGPVAPVAPGIRRVALYLGSAAGDSPAYRDTTVRTVEALAEAGYELVYGGGSVGLMGVAAETALASGMPVHGVITQHLMDGETGHRGLTRLDIVETMTERKERMADLADAMVTLPGGIGTLEEFFEVWTAQVLGLHTKPVALVDVDNYWQPLVDMVDHMVDRGFFSAVHRDQLIRVTDPTELRGALDQWAPAAAKWSAKWSPHPPRALQPLHSETSGSRDHDADHNTC